MMNEKGCEINTSIGCGVTECKYNRAGDYCTLRKIHVGNTGNSARDHLHLTIIAPDGYYVNPYPYLEPIEP